MKDSSKRSLSEADIKRRFITPALEAKWPANLIRMEYSFTDGRVIVAGNKTSRGACKRADYLLSWQPQLPLAVVEAKDNRHPVGAGLQQALAYAEILDVPFAYSSNGDAFIEHDRLLGTEKELALAGFPTPAQLWQRYRQHHALTASQERLVTTGYHFDIGGKAPRYYQRIAINRVVEAVSKGQDRILLAMATGTGKTFTAFQIAWRLWKAGAKKRILYLADRNVLVDQAMRQDFRPFAKSMTKVEARHLDSAFELYFSLYHQLAGDEGVEPFRAFRPEFFDLILIDECHRGSAKEESSWRKILDYFANATHIGMTATPKETKDTSNATYFGKPIYIYSLRQGIEDGFLAPYKVKRITLDRDAAGWRPEAGKLDKAGNPVEDREYTLRDFDSNLVIDERTQLVAEKITEFLKQNDRYARTIVFCEDTEHADRMRRALVNLNADMVARDSRYVVRITHDEHGKDVDLEDFTDERKAFPVIATTSDLLSTGVDCKTCKLIVLDKNISSDIEFKQIIGRGTRLRPDYGKEFFTIMDFRNVTSLFANDDFWVTPEVDENYEPEKAHKHTARGGRGEGRYKTYVDNVPVKVLLEQTQLIDENGKLITESVVDYSRKNILGEYARLEDFLKAWNSERRKVAILRELRERGVLIDAMREEAGYADLDEFDLICHIAWNRKPLTRAERARKVRGGAYLNKYEGLARDVLAALLDKYAQYGIGELADTNVLAIEPFLSMGGSLKIAKAFGGKQKLLEALDELQAQLYAA